MAKKKTGQQLAVAKSVSADVELPVRPQRPQGARPPGVAVELFTNLFRVSLKLEKPIYCHTIQIDAIDKAKAPTTSGDAKKPTLPRKIPKELRQQAVNNAVGQWLKNNQAAQTGLSYVLDGNASTMYSLFKMLDLHDGSPGTRRHTEIIATVQSPRIVDQKATMESEKMEVRFYAPSPVDVRGLLDHCAGKLQKASIEKEASLKALNIILTGKILQAPNHIGMQAKSGSCSIFHYDRKNQFPISQGVVCNTGFITSVRVTEGGLVANVANSVVPFYEPLKLTELLAKRFGATDFSRGLHPKVVDELKRELRLKQVEAIHINYGSNDRPHYRKYRIHDIGKATDEEKFELEDPKTKAKSMISVYDYFRKEYPKCKLQYPKLPCIIDNQRKIPLEICRLVDKQKVNRRLTPLETSNVIKEAALKPDRHFDRVKQNATQLGNNDQLFRSFGLEFDRKLIELTGRELPQIKLLAANQTPLSTRDGAYEAFRSRFVKSPEIKKWTLIVIAEERFKRNFRDPQQCFADCGRFAQSYCQAGRGKGVKIMDLANDGLQFKWIAMNQPDQEIKKILRDEFTRLNKENYTHAIFVLPAIKDWIYSYMQYLEVDVPNKIGKAGPCTRASCIKEDNFVKKILRGDERSVGMFLSNLWLKYNTKMGGVNHVLDARQTFGIDSRELTAANNFLQPNYLFVSIDVCHPAPGDKLEQSVAAAVGMWNITNPSMATCTRVRVQRKESSDTEKSTVEQVGEIGVMFSEILKSYEKKTVGKAPTHIVILRDGVSDGQFHMVLRFELSQVKASIKQFYGNLKLKEPLLSCLTVQKRHRTRFMRKTPVQTRKGPDYNIQPGTVVDTQVVEPLHHSFYLAPHKAIQGTARAPHVYMIYDEIKFSQDAAQAMIFALSYLSPRCTKGTSIPTPVNLADLAAERGKHIVISWNEDNPQKMSADERLIKLNAFLSNMGDASYQDTLYYV